MPLINFQCTKCSTKFSELVLSRDKDKVKCPECQAPVKQIYEGKCNSLKPSSGEPAQAPCCPGCSKACPMN